MWQLRPRQKKPWPGGLDALEREYREKLEKAQAEGDAMEIARGWNNLGTVFADRGQWDKALAHYEKALESLSDASPLEDHLTAPGNAAAAARQLGEWDKALRYALQVEVVAGRHDRPDDLEVSAGAVALVRQAVGLARFREMLEAALAELPEDQRPYVQTERHLNPTVRKEKEPGRNDPCPCGSGQKYKKCCARRK